MHSLCFHLPSKFTILHSFQLHNIICDSVICAVNANIPTFDSLLFPNVIWALVLFRYTKISQSAIRCWWYLETSCYRICIWMNGWMNSYASTMNKILKYKIRYAQKLLIYRHFIQCSSCYKTVKYENAEQLFHGCWTVWNDFTLE